MSEISTPADEAAMKAARVAIFGEDRKDGDFASGPWAIRPADLAKHMRAFADAEIAAAEARGVAKGLEMARPELKRLYRGYVNTLESARDIFMAMGRDCDPVDRMEHGDPALRSARDFIAAIDARLSAMGRGE